MFEQYLSRKIVSRIAALGLLLGVAVGLAFAVVLPVRYTAEATLYVTSTSPNSATAAYQGGLLSQQRVRSYAELARSPRVLQAVAQELRLSESPEALANSVQAVSSNNSVVLTIAASATDASRAAAIANATADNLRSVVAELEAPADGAALPPVAVRTVQPATVPGSPSSVSGLLWILGGAIGGMVGLVALAYLAQVIDPRIRRLQDLAPYESRDMPIGSVPTVDQGSSSGAIGNTLITNSLDRFATVMNARHGSAVLAVTSSIESEGKTTSTVALGRAMNRAALRVLLIEADLRRPALAKLLNLEPKVGLTSVLSRRTSVADATQHVEPGLDALAAGPLPPNPSELLASEQMSQLLAEVGERYDAILIDTPPCLPVSDAKDLSSGLDGFIFTCRRGWARRAQVRRAWANLSGSQAPVVGLFYTFARDDEVISSQRAEWPESTEPDASDSATTETMRTRPSPSPRGNR